MLEGRKLREYVRKLEVEFEVCKDRERRKDIEDGLNYMNWCWKCERLGMDCECVVDWLNIGREVGEEV